MGSPVAPVRGNAIDTFLPTSVWLEREDPSPCLSPVRGKERRETGERDADSLAFGSLDEDRRDPQSLVA